MRTAVTTLMNDADDDDDDDDDDNEMIMFIMILMILGFPVKTDWRGWKTS